MKIMNIMLALVVVFCLFSCSSIINRKQSQSTKLDLSSSITYDSLSANGNTVYNFKKYNTSIISISGTLYFIYNPVNPISLKETGEIGQWNVLINASYFAGSASKAKHVGLLNIYGKSIAQKEYDKQLTHIIQYDKEQHNIRFFEYNDYKPVNSKNMLEIQTGPLVIENNKLAAAYIAACINGGRKAERTLIAAIDDKLAFFIVVRDKVNLTELGNFLLQVPIFAGKKLDVMNLDGGSSTSLYLRNFPQLNFKDSKQLPFLLGIK